MESESVGLHLQTHHIRKLSKGGNIQLNASQLDHAIRNAPTVGFNMAKKHVSEMLRAHRNNKGIRLMHKKIMGGKITLHSVSKALHKAGHTVAKGVQKALKNPAVKKVAKELAHIGVEMANNHAQTNGVNTQPYANMAHKAVESKNIAHELEQQVSNDVINYAHQQSGVPQGQHYGGKLNIGKEFKKVGRKVLSVGKKVMSNPIAQGVATNLITGAIMGAGKKRFAKGSAEAKAHMARIRSMRKGGALMPAGSGARKRRVKNC